MMNTSAKRITRTLALSLLLAAACNADADDSGLVPATAATVSAAAAATAAQLPAPGSGDREEESTDANGILSLLLSGFAWPLVGGVLLLAAVNSRKPSRRGRPRDWRWGW